MKGILVGLGALAAASFAHAETTVTATTAVWPTDGNAYCEASGERWAEHGYICHSDRGVREPIYCTQMVCSIPSGWGDAFRASPDSVPCPKD